MRLGLLGLGRIGAFHAETLAGLPAVEELVLSDPVPALAEQAAGRLGARIAGSPGAVLASGVDGMVIAAPTGLHAELIELCVAAGLPTFCEKPVARDSDEAARLARRVADADVQVQIGYPRRFDPAFAAARAAVADGDLGVVHTVRSTTLDPAPPPRAYLAASGGIFRDCAVHDFDAVRWVTGQEVTEVYAAGTNQGAEWFGELGDVHTASAVLTLDGGALAVVSNTRYNARGHDVRLEVHGTRDSLAAGLGPGLPLRSAEPGVSFPDGKPFTFFMDRLAGAFRAELAAFTEVVAGRRASPCTVLDAIETGWVAEACTLSLREHRPVQIEEVRIPTTVPRQGWRHGQSPRRVADAGGLDPDQVLGFALGPRVVPGADDRHDAPPPGEPRPAGSSEYGSTLFNRAVRPHTRRRLPGGRPRRASYPGNASRGEPRGGIPTAHLACCGPSEAAGSVAVKRLR